MSVSRYVLEGGAACGKTTVLFGKSFHPDSDAHERLPCLEDLHLCKHEVFFSLLYDAEKNSMRTVDSIPNLFERYLQLELENYEFAREPVTFYERGFQSIGVLCRFFEMKIPVGYEDYCWKYRYNNPIFLLESIQEVDLQKGEDSNRTWTPEQRIAFEADIKAEYLRFNYDIITIPNYLKDIRGNVKARKKAITQCIASQRPFGN